MAANSSAHPLKAGFNQSGGAYFMVVNDLEARAAANTAPTAVGSYINTLTTAGSGSGGAFVSPTLALASVSSVMNPANAGQASTMSGLFGKGALLKDMGRSIVSSGRVFRKFAPVVGNLSSFGVVGVAGAAPNAGYGSVYLEVGREGQGAATPAPIARYF